MRDALLEWKDVTGDEGNLQIPYDDASIISISLYDNSDDTEVHACHDLDIPTARALHKALGRALAEVDHRPVTDSISATLATCSAPVPEIIRVHPSGAGDHGSIDVTTGDGLTRYAVQQVLGKSLRDVTVDELAKLGLKPSQPEPPPTGDGASALHPRPFWWDFDDGRFVAVDDGHNYLGIETVDDLLEHIPNALNGLESKYPRDAHELPSFGFRREHTGPRTLREYLEAP